MMMTQTVYTYVERKGEDFACSFCGVMPTGAAQVSPVPAPRLDGRSFTVRSAGEGLWKYVEKAAGGLVVTVGGLWRAVCRGAAQVKARIFKRAAAGCPAREIRSHQCCLRL